jgi:RNA polymerase sigma factor (TIGR02999 family)
MASDERDVTGLLAAWEDGDQDAFDRLVPIVYDNLRRIAHRQLSGEQSGHTLDTTGLVHECYLSLAGSEGLSFLNRRQFYALAATAMRHILVNYARARARGKRGGGRAPVTLDDSIPAPDARADELLGLDAALDRLEERDPRLVRLVECRFFAGLTVREAAEALGVSERTAERDWARAKVHLYNELRDPGVAESP